MTEQQQSRDGRTVRFAGASLALLAIFAILVPVAFSPATFNDGDTSWHLAAGRLILDLWAVPDTDPFSFTFAGQKWVAHEWLAEAILAAAFQAGGWRALALLVVLGVGSTLLILGRRALASLPLLAAIAVTLLAGLVLMPFALARPHVLAWPLLALWTTSLLRSREAGAAPPPALALVMLAWANLHGSFALGLALVGVFALEALIEEADKARALRRWGLFALLALVAALATPHHVHGLLFPLEVSRMESLHLIGEWRATSLAKFPMFALSLPVAAAAIVAGRAWRRPLRLLLVVALAYLAFAHVRHQALWAIIAAPILLSAVRQRFDFGLSGRASLVPFAAAALALAAVRLAVPMDRPDSDSNPLTAIANIPPELRDRPVLNSYAFGGPLIFAGIRPYIDGRADMYGDMFLFHHRRMMHGDFEAFARTARQHSIGWTILSPRDPLSAELDRRPGWRRIYSDPKAVIHVAD